MALTPQQVERIQMILDRHDEETIRALVEQFTLAHLGGEPIHGDDFTVEVAAEMLRRWEMKEILLPPVHLLELEFVMAELKAGANHPGAQATLFDLDGASGTKATLDDV